MKAIELNNTQENIKERFSDIIKQLKGEVIFCKIKDKTINLIEQLGSINLDEREFARNELLSNLELDELRSFLKEDKSIHETDLKKIFPNDDLELLRTRGEITKKISIRKKEELIDILSKEHEKFAEYLREKNILNLKEEKGLINLLDYQFGSMYEGRQLLIKSMLTNFSNVENKIYFQQRFASNTIVDAGLYNLLNNNIYIKICGCNQACTFLSAAHEIIHGMNHQFGHEPSKSKLLMHLATIEENTWGKTIANAANILCPGILTLGIYNVTEIEQAIYELIEMVEYHIHNSDYNILGSLQENLENNQSFLPEEFKNNEELKKFFKNDITYKKDLFSDLSNMSKLAIIGFLSMESIISLQTSSYQCLDELYAYITNYIMKDDEIDLSLVTDSNSLKFIINIINDLKNIYGDIYPEYFTEKLDEFIDKIENCQRIEGVTHEVMTNCIADENNDYCWNVESIIGNLADHNNE